MGNVEGAISAWQLGLKQVKNVALTIDLHLRLADTLTNADRFDEATQTLETLDEAILLATPRVTKAARNTWGRASLLRWAQLYTKQGNHRKAVPMLERLTSGATVLAHDDEARLWAMLGSARAATGEWDSAAAAYERATSLAVEHVPYREAAAAAWASAQRPDAAIRHFDSIEQRSPEGTVIYTRALLQQQLQRPKGDRDWGPVRQSLANAEAMLAGDLEIRDPWRIALIRADVEFAQGTPEGRAAAVTSLVDIGEAYADNAELNRRLIFIFEQIDEPQLADDALARFTVLGSAPQSALVRSHLLSKRGEHAEARKLLEAALKQYPAEAESLKVGLVQISLNEGRFDDAMRGLQALENRDLPRLRQLAEMALNTPVVMPASRNRDEFRRNLKSWGRNLEKWEDELRVIEGSEGTYWRYYKARRLIALAESAGDPKLAEAAKLQTAIVNMRPQWPSGHTLAGMIADRDGRPTAAIDAYAEAIRLGERKILVFQRLNTLLLGEKRAVEAAAYLARIEEYIPASSDLSTLALTVAVELDQLDRAIQVAKDAVEKRPMDPMAHVWLGQVLMLRSNKAKDENAARPDREQAEQVMQLACKITDDKDARPLNALFSFYLRTQQKEKALSTLQRVEKVPALDDATRAFVMAQGYELLGEQKQAEEQYLAAQELAPNSTAIPLRLAAFFMRTGDVDRAETALKRVLELDPKLRPARRTLAAVLAARGGEDEWKEVTRLLGPEVGEEGQLSHLDQRLQAVLLARRGRPDDIDDAHNILSRLVDQAVNTTPGDRILLAWTSVRKCELLDPGDPARGSLLRMAQRQYQQLASQREPHPTHLALFVDFLIRQEIWEDADTHLIELERLEPDSPRSITLRARLLNNQANDPDTDADDKIKSKIEIKSKIDGWVAKLEQEIGDEPTDEQRKVLAARYLAAGKVYSELQSHDQAEEWYRRVVELEENAYGPLVMALASQISEEKTHDAIQICLQRAKDADTATPAIVLASVLVSGKVAPSDFALAEPLFQKWLKEEENNPNLLLAVGNVRYLQKNLGEAERLFRRVIELRPRDAVAHNNLATLLSELDGRIEEARKYVERAIELSGEQPALLDTKGMILVNDDQLKDAVNVLKRAASNENSDPRFVLHLVIALDRDGKEKEAQDAWSRINVDYLNRMILSSSDETARDRFVNRFGANK